MDTFVQRFSNSTNGFDYHQKGYKSDNSFSNSPISPASDPSPSSTISDGYSPPEEGDCSDACLKYINQILMEEEDLDNKPCMYHDCMSLQAAEKSFYDVLVNPNHESPDCDSTRSFIESNWVHNQGQFDPSFEQSSHFGYTFESNNLESFGYSIGFHGVLDGSIDSYVKNKPKSGITKLLPNENYVNSELEQDGKTSKDGEEIEENRRDNSLNGSRGKKNHYREDSDKDEGGRSNKQFAVNYVEEPVESAMFDKVLLCPALNPHLHHESELPNGKFQQKEKSKSSTVGRPRGRKKGQTKEMVDLRTLLTQCAETVSSSDSRTATDLINRIRQHSSEYGDGNERLAHYFANALEARLAGTGMPLYTCFTSRRISTAEILKAYQVYVSACPFGKMSYAYANKTIGNVAKNATRLHIIDFGILYGFQWPCLIQRLSMRPGGPPKLRITGIEFPQPGFRPEERVEETGRCLASYCKRFDVPFEYNAIAKKWHTIQLEDLKIDADEALVVNCLYRLKNVPDDTIAANSPRDDVLNLIKKINPEIFIHGAINGTFNAPFFVTRFREALFHFSALFDMFEASVPREDVQRMLFEKEVFGRDIMNVLACEGTERVERPETYKQWKVRNMRAGFRQLPLDQEIVDYARTRVKLGYHKDFVVDEDRNWLLQGWKGRIIHALSCWKPILK